MTQFLMLIKEAAIVLVLWIVAAAGIAAITLSWKLVGYLLGAL